MQESPIIVNFQVFILETIGTQELILVGLVALIIFGPRKLPQMARKFGKMMTELKKVSNDFRSTWEREASLEEDLPGAKTEARNSRTIGPAAPIAQVPAAEPKPAAETVLPEIKEVSAEEFERLKNDVKAPEPDETLVEEEPEPEYFAEDKKTWL